MTFRQSERDPDRQLASRKHTSPICAYPCVTMLCKEVSYAYAYVCIVRVNQASPSVIHSPYKECSYVIFAVSDRSFNRKFILAVCDEKHAVAAFDQELCKRYIILRSSYV